MSGAIYTAAAGAISQQIRLEITANNLANLNTNAYKAESSVFRIPNLTSDSNVYHTSSGSPAMLSYQSWSDFSPGTLKTTGNTFDLALSGDGFFCLSSAEGIRFTRNGNFVLNSRGELSTPGGHPVLGLRGRIVVNGENIRVGSDGTIANDEADIDRLRIVDFPKPYLLTRIGNNMFIPQDTQGIRFVRSGAEVIQGALETSNVLAIREMTDMIEAGRLFESYSVVIKTLDESTGKLISRLGDISA